MMARILLVDDEAPILRMLQAYMEEVGFETQIAGDGIEAIRHLEKEEFDLVVCDYDMPQMDGIDLLKRVSATWPRIPVIIMTGYATAQNMDACLSAGAEDYLAKPFSRNALDDIVCRAIQKRQRIKEMYEGMK